MKRYNDNNNTNAVNQGWKLEDQWYLDREDNAESIPEIQILTEDNWED